MKLTTVLTITCLASVGATVLKGTPPSGGSNGSPSDSSQADAALIERFLQSGRPELKSYAARRLLTASTMGGRMQARLEAWTYLDPDGTFRFDIIHEEGSALIRDRVLVAALETERRSRRRQAVHQAALTRANYHFEVAAPAADGLVMIRLLPRRRSAMLLEGSVLAHRDSGDLVRIDGRLSEPPSWWTEAVDIVRRYARIRGVRVPIEMVSRAEVRLAGASSFSMSYHYTMINGQPAEPGSKADLRRPRPGLRAAQDGHLRLARRVTTAKRRARPPPQRPASTRVRGFRFDFLSREERRGHRLRPPGDCTQRLAQLEEFARTHGLRR